MNLLELMRANQLGAYFTPFNPNPFSTPATPTPSYSNPYSAPIPLTPINTNYSSTPPFVAPSSQPSNFGNYFNTVANLVSQFLGSRGKYQTSQTLTSGGNVVAVPQAYGQPNPYATPQPYYAPTAGQPGYAAASPGGAVGSGIDGIFNWLMANPLVLILGGAGLYLLFKQPPGRR